VSTMCGQADDMWMAEGLDLSVTFKEGMDAALQNLKAGAEDEIDLPHDDKAQLPDKWHESHEPPIRFISPRKDEYRRRGEQWMNLFLHLYNNKLCGIFAGFNLDEPLVFFYHCLMEEEEIERGDFLREIMDMLENDQTRQDWLARVDQLFEGEITWNEFSNLVANALDLKEDKRTNTTGPGESLMTLSF
jgi:hypothetical protein